MRRAGVVVLHELVGNAELRVTAAAVALVEETALVAVDYRLHQDRAVEPALNPLHVHLSWFGVYAMGPRRTLAVHGDPTCDEAGTGTAAHVSDRLA